MRFAWLLEQAGEERNESFIGRTIFILYNTIYWIPLILSVLGKMEYWDAFIWFALINIIRAILNAYRVNIMPIEKAQVFPLRAP